MLAKEQFAWAWLSGLVVVPTAYFLAVSAQTPLSNGGILPRLSMLGAALVTLAVVALGARFLTTGRGSRSKGFVADERDRHIESRSMAVAYHVLMGGMIVVGCVMPFSASPWELVDAAFFSIVLAEVVHYGLVLRGYRRGTRD